MRSPTVKLLAGLSLLLLLASNLGAISVSDQLKAANEKNKTLSATNASLAAAQKKVASDFSLALTALTNMQKQSALLATKLAQVQADLVIEPPPVVVVDPPPVVTPPPVVNPPPPVVNPPTTTTGDAAILAELTDSSLAGMNKRLGPSAADLFPQGLNVPDVWLRPKTLMTGVARASFSDSLGAQSDQPWDYGSTEAQFIGVADLPLIVAEHSSGDVLPNNGVGVWRLRTGEWGDGAVSEFSDIMWNGTGSAFPDKDTAGHTATYGMGDKLGRPIAVARARVNRYDGGFVLYDESRGGVGYIGTVGTQTAWSPWSGLTLPAGKVPLSMAVTSQNEFLLVGVYDRASGKGQMGIIALWGGPYDNNSFPFDFRVPMPGLVNSGVIVGMKILGWVDLPIKFPTNLSAACSPNPGSDRIEGADGNAAYLSAWDMSSKGLRDLFMAKNGGWVSTWGKACAVSKYESKAVMIDLSALFQAYRDQYFTTDAAYAVTRPQRPSNAWWDVYDNANPAAWPYMLPAWKPTIGAVIDDPNPTALLMAETGDAQVAIGSNDGTVRYFRFDGTANGSVKVGPNPTCINPDKYPAAGGIRGGGQIITCRGDRSVVRVNKFGPGAAVVEKIQDKRMLDPVYAEAGDTHGVEMRYITVADFAGKQTLNYRDTKLVFVTQGGAIYGTGPTTTADKAVYDKAVVDGTALPTIHEEVECGGVYALPGRPFAVCGSNVN